MKRVLAVCALGLLLAAAPASATSILYANDAAFVAATGSTLHPLPAGPITSTSITTTDTLLTLTSVNNLHTDWQLWTGTSYLAGPEMAVSGPENFDAAVMLGADRYAFGFSIYEPTSSALAGCNTSCVDSTFTITLYNNGLPVGVPFLLSPANDTAVFWGIHSSFAFDAVGIFENVGSNDNEIFGTFYTGVTAVPEPGTVALLGLGLAFAAFRRHRA